MLDEGIKATTITTMTMVYQPNHILFYITVINHLMIQIKFILWQKKDGEKQKASLNSNALAFSVHARTRAGRSI